MSKSSIQQLALTIDGEDSSAFMVYRASLKEEVSAISEYHVQFQSEAELESDDILFKKASIKITLDGQDRSFHGLVRSFFLKGVGSRVILS
jgi:Uncharacterized protein conserved in bacteria